MEDSLKPLLDLQIVDHARDRLEERKEHLPEKAELADVRSRMDELKVAIARVQTESEAVIREMNKLEGEVRLIEEKMSREQERLYSGEVVNPKELSALQQEIDMLRRRKEPLEEDALAQMMKRDDLGAEREQLEAQLSTLEAEEAEVAKRIDAALGELDRELGVENEKRDSILTSVPGDMVELYESLREQKRGVGVGALENGVCTACREALSAVEVDRIKRKAREGERRFRCEHCRRILVVS